MPPLKDEPGFSRPKPSPRTRMLTVRITEAQDNLITALAEAMGVDRAEVTRQALDYWMVHGPESRRVQGLIKGG